MLPPGPPQDLHGSYSSALMYATAYLFIDANNTLLVVNKPNQHRDSFFPFKQQIGS